MRQHLTLPAALVAASLSMAVTSAHAVGLVSNEFVTFGQASWGADPNGQNISTELIAQFDTVYASTNDLLEIGIPGTGGFSIIFDDGRPIVNYLPSSGTPGVLTADLLDPASSASGVFGGRVLALRLNIDFSDAGLTTHPNGAAFGDLILTGLTGTEASMNGLTVRELQSDVNTLLGGGTVPNISIADADDVTNDVDTAFNGGPISTFGMNDLELPPSAATPLPATLPLFASALGALGLLARRRKRQNAGRHMEKHRVIPMASYKSRLLVTAAVLTGLMTLLGDVGDADAVSITTPDTNSTSE